jgi:hypothetical protein
MYIYIYIFKLNFFFCQSVLSYYGRGNSLDHLYDRAFLRVGQSQDLPPQSGHLPVCPPHLKIRGPIEKATFVSSIGRPPSPPPPRPHPGPQRTKLIYLILLSHGLGPFLKQDLGPFWIPLISWFKLLPMPNCGYTLLGWGHSQNKRLRTRRRKWVSCASCPFNETLALPIWLFHSSLGTNFAGPFVSVYFSTILVTTQQRLQANKSPEKK